MTTLQETWLTGEAPPSEAYVAYFDVLGFKKWLPGRPLREAVKVMQAIQREVIEEVAKTARGGEWGGLEEPTTKSIQVTQMSDSLVLYTFEDSSRCVYNLFRAAVRTMLAAMRHGLLLRGAVSKGQLFVSTDRQLVLGEGLVRAYLVAESCAWAGCVVDDARIGGTPFEWNALVMAAQHHWLVEHPVPLHSDPRRRLEKDSLRIPPIAIAWPLDLKAFVFAPGGYFPKFLQANPHPYGESAQAFGAWCWRSIGRGNLPLMWSGSAIPSPLEINPLPQTQVWEELAARWGHPLRGYDPGGKPIVS